MSTADGPFAMETTYTWRDEPGSGTHMTLHNRGEPSGSSGLAAPLIITLTVVPDTRGYPDNWRRVPRGTRLDLA